MRIIKKLIVFILFIIITVISIYIGIGYKMYKNALKEMPIDKKITKNLYRCSNCSRRP